MEVNYLGSHQGLPMATKKILRKQSVTTHASISCNGFYGHFDIMASMIKLKFVCDS